MQFWNELEGKVLGDYPLLRLVRSEGRSAWFDTEIRNGETRPATISLTESLTDTEEVTERLQAAQRIQHPNLVAISKVGQGRLDGTLFVYAVMEHMDQNLSDVLREQALSAAEGRQVAEALVGALTEIHSRDLVHGRVEPASILAIGEAVKLRSDCLQAPGGTRAGDVSGIGETLFLAFTQRKPSSADDTLINRIPAPFAEIVRNSLSARWSLAQIAAVLKPPAPPAPTLGPVERPNPPAVQPVKPAAVPPPQQAPPQQAPRPQAPPQQAPQEQTRQEQTHREQALQEQTQQKQEDDKESVSRPRPTALYAVLALAFLLILGWLIFRPKAPEPASSAAPATVATPAPSPTQSGPAPAPLPPLEKTKPSAARLAPREPLTQAQSEPATRQSNPSGDAGTRTIWRVVAYTYRNQDQAQHKADEINHGHANLQASVFSPHRSNGTYLVVLGGAMDRSHAFAMRDKARAAGLPTDTYAQNFSE
jgi:eukaryotic-like serine/threonine-protein kinase